MTSKYRALQWQVSTERYKYKYLLQEGPMLFLQVKSYVSYQTSAYSKTSSNITSDVSAPHHPLESTPTTTSILWPLHIHNSTVPCTQFISIPYTQFNCTSYRVQLHLIHNSIYQVSVCNKFYARPHRHWIVEVWLYFEENN